MGAAACGGDYVVITCSVPGRVYMIVVYMVVYITTMYTTPCIPLGTPRRLYARWSWSSDELRVDAQRGVPVDRN